MISFENVSRKYGPVVAVNGVSLQIDRGEIVGLLGHNGAGKTTLMKMLTGYLEPTSGTIKVADKDVLEDRIGVQRQIGYLPENAPLYPEMLVQEYLFMMTELRGIPADQREAAVAKAASGTGLHGHMVKPISSLSKGYRQRVGIAQAILHDPDVLVLDEPTNGLDPVQIQSIRELIQRLGQNTTIILSTHILQEVEAVCDRVLVMIDGNLAADSPLSALLTSTTVHLAVGEGANVKSVIAELTGVTDVKKLSNANGFDTWAIDVDVPERATSQILSAGMDAGWTIGSVGPENKTLDAVFRQLQADYVAKEAR